MVWVELEYGEVEREVVGSSPGGGSGKLCGKY